MASTYSDLKIELIGTGEQVGTWGTTTNTNLGTALEEAIVGSATVSFSSADVTLTLTNTNGTQAARHLRLNLTGTSGGARNLILGSGCQIDKPYIINNGLADAVTVKNTTGTGVAVPPGKTMWVYNNGTNVVEVVTHVNASVTGNASTATALQNARTIGGVSFDGTANINLPGVNQAGNQNTTGSAATLTTGRTIQTNLASTSSATFNGSANITPGVTGTLPAGNGGTGLTAPGTSGNVLTSNGTSWVSSPAFVAGMIILWSGSTASIPTGWALCNGSNGTPDLRDRFVVGAGNNYAVNATGGSADAIVVSHTHTATSAVTDPGHTHTIQTVEPTGGSSNQISRTATGNDLNSAKSTNSATTGITVATTINSAGNSGANANLPPYYALAYIMKL